MDRLATIKAAMDADPEYAALDANAAADRMNERVHPGSVPSLDVIRYLTLVDKWVDIKIAAQSTDPLVAAKTKAALRIVSALADFEVFDMSNPVFVSAISAGLSGIVAAGLISEDEKAVIMGIGNNLRARGDVLGLGMVTGREVHMARGGA